MLKQIKLRLTLICTIITASILIITCITTSLIYEKQLNKQILLSLQNDIKSIHYYLQTNTTIHKNWLDELESTNHLIISIKENDVPLLSKSTFHTPSNTEELITRVEDVAQTQRGSLDVITSTADESTLFFEYRTKYNEHFLVSYSKLRITKSYCTLIILKDLSCENNSMIKLRFFFGILALLSTLLLLLFSHWFIGKVLHPITVSNQKQKEFIAAASHELRSPLAVMRTSLFSLQKEALPQQLHFISLIENESLRMTRLVNDLLLLANADSCHWHISKSETEMDTLLIELYETYLSIARQSHKVLKISLPNEMFPPLLVDKDRISQCLIILIDNAITHTPPNTQITLALQRNNHYIELIIQDNGNGIPNELKPRVFELKPQ